MNLAPQIRRQFFDNNGAPLAGGKIYSYLAGTTTPQATYSDSIGTANTNPIILDANGMCDLWIGSIALKFVVRDADDNILNTVDNVSNYPITTEGDIIIGGTSGIWERLAKGTSGYVLQMGTTKPQWVARPDLLTASTKTSNYTILVSDDFVRFDATSGALTATFPDATTSLNKVIIVKKTDSSFNAVTMSGTGLTTNKLMTVGETVAYVSDGTNWVQLWRETDTEWISYVLDIKSTNGDAGNPTKPNAVVNDAAKWRRIGDSIQVKYDYYHTSATGANAGTGIYQFPIPNSSSWTINSSKCIIPSTNTLASSIVGSAGASGTTVGQFVGGAYVSNSTRIFIIGYNGSSNTAAGQTNTPLTDATVIFTMSFTVPITDFQA